MPSYTLGSGLPDLPSGLTDKEAALVTPLYRAINAGAAQLSKQTGNVQYSQSELAALDPFAELTTQSSHKLYVQAVEAISYGQLVTIDTYAGKLGAWPANYANPLRLAHGLCDMPNGIAAGTFGTIVFMQGHCRGVANTIFGAVYYLSAAGTMQLTAPNPATHIVQKVAVGLGSAGVYLTITPWGNL